MCFLNLVHRTLGSQTHQIKLNQTKQEQKDLPAINKRGIPRGRLNSLVSECTLVPLTSRSWCMFWNSDKWMMLPFFFFPKWEPWLSFLDSKANMPFLVCLLFLLQQQRVYLVSLFSTSKISLSVSLLLLITTFSFYYQGNVDLNPSATTN